MHRGRRDWRVCGLEWDRGGCGEGRSEESVEGRKDVCVRVRGSIV